MNATEINFEQEGAEVAEMKRNPGLLMTQVGSTFSALSAISCSICSWRRAVRPRSPSL